MKSFSNYWGQMHSDLNQAKMTPFSELGDDLYDFVFSIKPTGGNLEKVCSVCGDEKESVVDWKSEETDEILRICPLCFSFFKEIGAELPRSNQIVLGFGEPGDLPDEGFSALDILSAFGMTVHFSDGYKDIIFNKSEKNKVERACVWELEDLTSSRVRIIGVPFWRMKHYSVHKVPFQAGHLLTFDELQDLAEGIPRLGVLRMDVDNLGNLFKNGLIDESGQSIGSLSRLSTLSFQLSLFFEGWIEEICSTLPDRIYSVYAGGDDLFLIAPWSDIPNLALKICEDFQEFTGNNPNLHISGGMAFIYGKYPIYQAAEDAGNAESQAKSFPGKNAFAYFGRAYSWEQFKSLSEKHEEIRNLVQYGKSGKPSQVPHALIGLLRELGDQAAFARKKMGKPVYGPWIWRGDYSFSRMIERVGKKEPVLAEGLRKINESLKLDMYRNIEDYAAAARWTQLEIRKKYEEEIK